MNGLSPDAVSAVRGVVARVPSLRRALDAILDARERRGRLPGRITVAATGEDADALAEIVSARAVTRLGGRVRIDLARADAVCRDQLGDGLDALLYAALDRAPAIRGPSEWRSSPRSRADWNRSMAPPAPADEKGELSGSPGAIGRTRQS